MVFWFLKKRPQANPVEYENVTSHLADLYKDKLKPIEAEFHYRHFHSLPFTQEDFSAKPMILIMGQYSTGKSSFIRYILQQDYPGIRVSPEPTTEKFVCVMGGPHDRVVPGNAVSADTSLPFTQLTHDMNETFFHRFQVSVCSSPALDGITLVDTPGVLSGEKQRTERGYDFDAAATWFANRANMIILLFDARSLDISDEFSQVIQKIKGNTAKIRVVLNKADSVEPADMVRVYGALTWALAKVLNTPEAPRIYIGSFWDQPLVHDNLRPLFEKDTLELFNEIACLPKTSTLHFVDTVIKRAQLLRVHACVIMYLRAKVCRGMGGRKAKQAKQIARMPEILQEIAVMYGIAKGDFPDVGLFTTTKMADYDLTTLPKVSDKYFSSMLSKINELLVTDIPRLMQQLPSESLQEKEALVPQVTRQNLGVKSQVTRQSLGPKPQVSQRSSGDSGARSQVSQQSLGDWGAKPQVSQQGLYEQGVMTHASQVGEKEAEVSIMTERSTSKHTRSQQSEGSVISIDKAIECM